MTAVFLPREEPITNFIFFREAQRQNQKFLLTNISKRLTFLQTVDTLRQAPADLFIFSKLLSLKTEEKLLIVQR